MKTLLTTLLMLVGTLCSFADDVKGITVNTATGKTEYDIASISKIKFDGDNMVIYLTDNTQQTFAVTDITVITLGDITAIQAVFDDASADTKAVVTELSGRIVAQGSLQSVSAQLRSGIYIISANGKTRKIAINK